MCVCMCMCMYKQTIKQQIRKFEEFLCQQTLGFTYLADDDNDDYKQLIENENKNNKPIVDDLQIIDFSGIPFGTHVVNDSDLTV